MNPLALQDVDNEMLRDADEYLRKHKILELFEVTHIYADLILILGLDHTSCLQAAREHRAVPRRTSQKQKRKRQSLYRLH